MTLLIIRMNVLSEKRMELSQTIAYFYKEEEGMQALRILPEYRG